MNQIKKTDYVPKAVLYGSREKLCINDEVRQDNSSNIQITLACRNLGSDCRFKSSDKKLDKSIFAQDSFDIENLHLIGKEME